MKPEFHNKYYIVLREINELVLLLYKTRVHGTMNLRLLTRSINIYFKLTMQNSELENITSFKPPPDVPIS